MASVGRCRALKPRVAGVLPPILRMHPRGTAASPRPAGYTGPGAGSHSRDSCAPPPLHPGSAHVLLFSSPWVGPHRTPQTREGPPHWSHPSSAGSMPPTVPRTVKDRADQPAPHPPRTRTCTLKHTGSLHQGRCALYVELHASHYFCPGGQVLEARKSRVALETTAAPQDTGPQQLPRSHLPARGGDH